MNYIPLTSFRKDLFRSIRKSIGIGQRIREIAKVWRKRTKKEAVRRGPLLLLEPKIN